MVSFKDITSYSTCIDENEFFKQFYNKDAAFRFDSNYFELKYTPSLLEFELIEEMQLAFHQEVRLNHLKFYWPENTGFSKEIMEYFDKEGYELEMLELYSISPLEFRPTRAYSQIEVQYVTEKTLEEFKKISYQQDLEFGREFADPKQHFYDWQFESPSIRLVLATINGKAAGTLTMVISEETIEIDDVATVLKYRSNGVATALQKFVMKEAQTSHKQVILVADGEDTPKQMYQRQGYQYVSYQLGAQKVLNKE